MTRVNWSGRIGFFVALAGAAVVSLGAALISGSGPSASEFAGITPEAVRTDIAPLTRIEVQTIDGDYVLARSEAGWVMPGKGDFPVVPEKAEMLIRSLDQAMVIEAKTSLSERYDALGLGDPENGGFGAKLTLEPGGTSLVFGVRGARHYMRRESNPRAHLIGQAMPPLHNAVWWIDLSETGLPRPSSDIVQLDVHASGQSRRFVKPAGVWIDGVSEAPVPVLIESALQFMSDALSGFTAEDVRASTGLAPSVQYRLVFADGTVGVIEFVTEDSDIWTRFDFRGDGDWSVYEGREFRLDALTLSDLLADELVSASSE